MNKLSTERRAAVIGCLVEGMSVRGTCRITGAARDTVNKLLLDMGRACAEYQDAAFRNLDIKRIEAVMEASDVIEVIVLLRRDGIEFWLDGGWGIDALLGSQHRPHDDLDIVVPLAAAEHLYETLAIIGYRVAEDLLPTRAVLRDDNGRQIDLHPITFDESGTGWQARAMPNGDDCEYPASEFVTGLVGDTEVGCLSAELQLAHHLGYDPRPHDRDDIARLAERFTLDLPDIYTSHE